MPLPIELIGIIGIYAGLNIMLSSGGDKIINYAGSREDSNDANGLHSLCPDFRARALNPLHLA